MRPPLARFLLLLALAAPALAQGPLSPTAAPAPQGKTLDQIEPRTPLAGGTAGLTISQPGSYYLTGNITVASGNGITVNADNVSLDLRGFTISSAAASPTGIGISLPNGRANVSITNGHVRGARVFSGGAFSGGGFNSGIDYSSPVPRSVRVTHVSVSGVGTFGIDLGSDPSSVITGCTVRTAGSLGLRAGVVADSAALEVGGIAISAETVANSVGTLTGAGTAVQSAAPTLATLDPRVRIPGGTAGFTITARGSYVLTGNLTVASGNGITISADDVSLDLNGFTIAGTAASPAAGAGVSVGAGRQNVVVRNGIIRGGTTYSGGTGGTFSGGGFADGISAPSVAGNVRVEAIVVAGVAGSGIDLDSSGLLPSVRVQDSTVRVAGGTYGIHATVVDGCTAEACQIGISANVATNSAGESVFTTPIASGISANTVANCRGRAPGGTGIEASDSVHNSTGFGQTGIQANTGIASYCQGLSVGGTGLFASIAVACKGQGSPAILANNRYLMP